VYEGWEMNAIDQQTLVSLLNPKPCMGCGQADGRLADR
jgi:hypothetical protein